MSERAPKAKTKPRADEIGVLGALPSARPQRLGKPRRAVAAPAPKPRAVRAAAPQLETRQTADPPPQPLGPPSGRELVATTIRATGELAQIGLVVGGQVLKRTLRHLPRP
jgi:hypothetical protein